MARLIAWLVVLALAACTGSPSGSSSVSPLPTDASAPAEAACLPIELRTPSGERIDLSGAWTGGSTIHFVRQIGTCVWWEAVSNLPGDPLGTYWRNVFHGTVAPDFTLAGDWAEIFNNPSFRQGDEESGWVQFDISFETTSGEESVVLVRGATRGDPYRPESLERIEMPTWPIAPTD